MRVTKKIFGKVGFKVVASIFLITAITLSFTQLSCKSKGEKVIKIGAILPLTGNASVLGQFVQQGLETARAILNEGGGINGDTVVIVYGDSKNSPKEGINEFQRLVTVSKPPVVISAMSSVSEALIPLADKYSVVLFATTVSVSGFPSKSPWAFRLFITADIDATVAAKFAFNKLRARRAIIVYVEDDFGVSFKNIFSKVFRNLGGNVVKSESYGKEKRNFRDIVTKIKRAKADIIYLLGYDKNLGVLIKQIREAKIYLPIMSIATVSQPYVIEQAGEAINGVYFTSTIFDPKTPSTQESKRFVEKYRSLYGKEPNYFSAFAYDVVMLIAEAIRKGGNEPMGIREALLKIKNYRGVMGLISFNKDGDAYFPMVVKKIEDGRIVDVNN